MNVIHRSIMIPIEQLKPHPDNPRKDVGDVAELAESIKANGIFQNLTVIPDDDTYMVVIGHRRLAAAKAAGLTELPCMVVEMDAKEQISTMLLENMQRNDLTIWEQAQGFQMMLDLGETESDIAEKTGFSKTTVRHRLKLLELDPEEFRKSQERQPTMADYIELEKISDPKLKSKALAAIGTANYKWTIESCKRHQRELEIRNEWLSFIDDLFMQDDYDKNRKIVKTVYMTKKMNDDDKKELKELSEDIDLDYCYTEGNTYLYILGAILDKPKPTYEEERQKRNERIECIKVIEEQAKKLRQQFVKDYKSKTTCHKFALLAFLKSEIDLMDTSWDRVAEILDLPESEDKEDGYDAESIQQQLSFESMAAFSPDRLLLAILSDYFEDWHLSVHSWDGHYQRNESLECWYDTLTKLGYSMSTDEQQLLDGTHECFNEEAEDENTATE